MYNIDETVFHVYNNRQCSLMQHQSFVAWYASPTPSPGTGRGLAAQICKNVCIVPIVRGKWPGNSRILKMGYTRTINSGTRSKKRNRYFVPTFEITPLKYKGRSRSGWLL